MKVDLVRVRNQSYYGLLFAGWAGIPLTLHHSNWYLKAIGIVLVTGWVLAAFWAFVSWDLETANEGM